MNQSFIIETATIDELKAELEIVCEEGLAASDLYAFLDPFTAAGREAEGKMTRLMLKRNAILARLRELAGK